MKKILNEYKKQITYFFTNKIYVICVIIVALLSYGFTITHYSIGIDDLCFDRYVDGNYILVAKRWGTWLLYNLLNIHNFTPFWLDLLTTLNIIFIAILICSFLRKNLKNKINEIPYTIFSCILISSPIIFNFYFYQTTSLSVSFSAIIMISFEILLFENFFENNNNRTINSILGILTAIPISMYESCIQIFLVMCGLSIFIRSLTSKDKPIQIIKFLFLNLVTLLIGFVIYYLIGSVIIAYLKKNGKYVVNFAFEKIPWESKEFREKTFAEKIEYLVDQTKKVNTLSWIKDPTIYFNFAIITIVFLMEIYNLIKNKKVIRFLSIIMILLSNFLLCILQGVILYRAELSLSITIALSWLYLFYRFSNIKYLKYIFSIFTILFILLQTQVITKMFYIEYQRFEKEKNIAINIGLDITKNFNYANKPVLYTGISNENPNGEVLRYGITAFNEFGVETTKFINNFGFHLKCIKQDKATIHEAVSEINNVKEEFQDNNCSIIETDKYIIVDLEKYGLKN